LFPCVVSIYPPFGEYVNTLHLLPVLGHNYKGLSKEMCHKYQMSSQVPWNCHLLMQRLLELLVYWEGNLISLGLL